MTSGHWAVSVTEASGESGAVGTVIGSGAAPAPESAADAPAPERERGLPERMQVAGVETGTERPGVTGAERGAVTGSVNAGAAAGTVRGTATAPKAPMEKTSCLEKGPRREWKEGLMSSQRESPGPKGTNSDETKSGTRSADAVIETGTADETGTESTNETGTETGTAGMTGTRNPRTRPPRRTMAPH